MTRFLVLLVCVALEARGCCAFLVGGATRTASQSRLFSTSSTERVAAVIQETSAARFSGGEICVDMNEYNLETDLIAESWTAEATPASPLQEAGVYLGAKNSQEILVDTIKVELPRRMGEGLGLELLELAGGRADGLGITVVSGIVEAGCAADSGILIGDSLTKIEVCNDNRNGISAVSTECLGYDATVEAILSLPVAESDSEWFVLTLKRPRRKPKVQVTFQYPPEMDEKDITLELFSGENLRRSMLVKGVKLNDALARRFDGGGSGDCGAEGTCGTCAVSVGQGEDLLGPTSQIEQNMFRNNPRWRMSCKTVVGYGMKEGEMIVRLSPQQW